MPRKKENPAAPCVGAMLRLSDANETFYKLPPNFFHAYLKGPLVRTSAFMCIMDREGKRREIILLATPPKGHLVASSALVNFSKTTRKLPGGCFKHDRLTQIL
jgi:hypothetical protein